MQVLGHEDDMRGVRPPRSATARHGKPVQLAQADLPALEEVCREELDAEEARA